MEVLQKKLLVFVAIFIVVITLCTLYISASKAQSEQKQDNAVAITPVISLLLEEDELPPDPGEEGKETLEGVDSDNDGVRDDIQRWIALESDQPEMVQAALTQSAKTYQKLLIEAEDEERSIENSQSNFNDYFCMRFLFGDTREGIEEQTALRGTLKINILNTEARVRAFLKADSSSYEYESYIPTSAESKIFCKFNVNE